MKLFIALILAAHVAAFSPFCDGATIIVNSYALTAAGGGSPTYLINQNFEGTGYDNGETWTETGTPNEDFTVAILKGSQSYNAVGANYAQISFTGQTDIWFHCRTRYQQFGTSSNIQVTNTAETPLVAININVSGAVKIDANGGLSSASASTASLNTTYYLWLHFVSGGTCELFMSTTSTRPTVDGSGEFVLTKTGASDTATKILLYAGSSGDIIVDNVLISASSIGNNPNP